jgi:predicted MFS family arabinose efflux permease
MSLRNVAQTNVSRFKIFLSVVLLISALPTSLSFQHQSFTAQSVALAPLASLRSPQLSHREFYPPKRWRNNAAHSRLRNHDDLHSVEVVPKDPEPRLYSQRWIQLLYLSLLALLSDWICFSVAALPETFESVYTPHTAASLIDLFLFTNVVSCFFVTDVVARIGLQRAIQGSAILMTMGCWFRSGFSFLPFVGLPHTNSLVSYPLVVLGTVLVGMSQPFFQCTPPLLSATWFAPSERSTSTAIALNFNQIGIATAFLVGGAMAGDRYGLSNYMGLIAVICTAVTAGTLMQFENEPEIPPSKSELTKKLYGEKEPPFLTSVQRLFKKSGFTQALAAFVCSISITNIVGTFIDDIMERGGITEQLSIDLAGAGFELAILLGGILIGGYVDRTKQYKNVTLACLAITAVTVIPLGLTEHRLGNEPILLIFSLLVRLHSFDLTLFIFNCNLPLRFADFFRP